MITRKEGRAFLSNKIWEEAERESRKTDQMEGKPQPPLEKSTEGFDLMKLPDPNSTDLLMKDFREIIFSRESRRVYSDEKISLEALSFLLWSSQGVKGVLKNNYATLRTVPSAGARHPFETYIFVRLVKRIEEGFVSLRGSFTFSDSSEGRRLRQRSRHCRSRSEVCWPLRSHVRLVRYPVQNGMEIRSDFL